MPLPHEGLQPLIDDMRIDLRGCDVRVAQHLLNGAKIGKNSIVGAGALITSGIKIPERSLVLGSPARVVRELTDEEVATVSRYADNYARYTRIYLGKERPERNPFY